MKSSLRAHGSREMRARCQAPRSDPDTVIPGWSQRVGALRRPMTGSGPDLRCAIAHRGISRFRVRCGACHRAALRADPLASPRNDGVWIVVASRLAITSLLFQTHVRDLAAQCARGVDESSAQRGRGECRVPNAPAVSCALCSGRTHTSNNEYTGNHPASPHAMVLTAYTVLSPAIGLFCHRRLRKLPFANLTPASRRQDHTTLPSASAPFVIGASASTASHPASVTIAIRPSCGEDGGYIPESPIPVK